MMHRAAVKICMASLAFLAPLIPLVASAATWTAFGPEVVLRSAGKPTAVKRTFSVRNPNAVYVLHVKESSGGKVPHGALEITLNGVTVKLGPVSSSVTVAGWPVRLRATNELVIELRGSPGKSVSVSIVGVDTGHAHDLRHYRAGAASIGLVEDERRRLLHLRRCHKRGRVLPLADHGETPRERIRRSTVRQLIKPETRRARRSPSASTRPRPRFRPRSTPSRTLPAGTPAR